MSESGIFLKGCNNCRWYSKCITEYPCSHCEVCDHTKWEPDVEKGNYYRFDPVRWLDPTEYTPNWEEQAKAIKQLEVRANDAADPYRYIYDYFNRNSSWGIAQPIELFSNMPDNTSVIKLDFDVDILKEDNNMKKQQNQKRRNRNQIRCNGNYCRDISEIMFNGPATVIKWSPSIEQWAYNKKGDKTVAVCGENDKFDKTTGFLLAIIKEFFDNQSYDNILRKIDGFYEEEAETRRYNLDDQVTCIKSKKHVVYEIDNYRWNPDDKIWMYRCVTENGYTRWYPESSLINIE